MVLSFSIGCGEIRPESLTLRDCAALGAAGPQSRCYQADEKAELAGIMQSSPGLERIAGSTCKDHDRDLLGACEDSKHLASP